MVEPVNPFDLLALQGLGVAYSALPTAFVLYFLLLFDARRKDSPSAGDTQLGIKTVAATIAIVATAMLAMGLQSFLHVILTFDDFGARMKAALPNLVFGGLGIVAAAFVLFPRTNVAQYPKAKRLAAGIVALVSGAAMLPALAMFLQRLLAWPSWGDVAAGLATAVDAVVIFGASFAVLGRLSGIDMRTQGPSVGQGIGAGAHGPPPIQAPAPQQVQPQHAAPQGYPPQGQPPQGYPQAQAPQGYPQQGYPQQGQPPQGAPAAPVPNAGSAPIGPGWSTPGGG